MRKEVTNKNIMVEFTKYTKKLYFISFGYDRLDRKVIGIFNNYMYSRK